MGAFRRLALRCIQYSAFLSYLVDVIVPGMQSHTTVADQGSYPSLLLDSSHEPGANEMFCVGGFNGRRLLALFLLLFRCSCHPTRPLSTAGLHCVVHMAD